MTIGLGDEGADQVAKRLMAELKEEISLKKLRVGSPDGAAEEVTRE
ncbi:MAG TPA: hypothetical protein VFW87_24725 [Pirellulales bacterium]|nr:hypothetical protein [Pirellulales bacterium]